MGPSQDTIGEMESQAAVRSSASQSGETTPTEGAELSICRLRDNGQQATNSRIMRLIGRRSVLCDNALYPKLQQRRRERQQQCSVRLGVTGNPESPTMVGLRQPRHSAISYASSSGVARGSTVHRIHGAEPKCTPVDTTPWKASKQPINGALSSKSAVTGSSNMATASVLSSATEGSTKKWDTPLQASPRSTTSGDCHNTSDTIESQHESIVSELSQQDAPLDFGMVDQTGALGDVASGVFPPLKENKDESPAHNNCVGNSNDVQHGKFLKQVPPGMNLDHAGTMVNDLQGVVTGPGCAEKNSTVAQEQQFPQQQLPPLLLQQQLQLQLQLQLHTLHSSNASTVTGATTTLPCNDAIIWPPTVAAGEMVAASENRSCASTTTIKSGCAAARFGSLQLPVMELQNEVGSIATPLTWRFVPPPQNMQHQHIDEQDMGMVSANDASVEEVVEEEDVVSADMSQGEAVIAATLPMDLQAKRQLLGELVERLGSRAYHCERILSSEQRANRAMRVTLEDLQRQNMYLQQQLARATPQS